MMREDKLGKLSILVAGGGTAGHIEPALAVAEALRDEYGAQVVALGTARGLETDLVPQRGFPLELIDPVPVPRKPSVDLLKLPYRVVRAVRQTKKVLNDRNIDAVVGFGGYVSAPAYLAAKLAKIPFVVHEANARAGMANKLGVRLGGIGLNATADSGLAGRVVGVPIRAELRRQASAQERQEAYASFGLDPAKKTLLVTGGSQGAMSINRAVADAVERITAAGFQVLHAYGKKNEAPAARDGYVAVPYITDMAAALAVADLIVSRAGAMTVAEVTASGVPAIYVPLPHGNGEQALNAMPIVSAGGAQLINDAELTADVLADQVIALLLDDDIRAVMSRVASNTGLGNAAAEVAKTVVEALS